MPTSHFYRYLVIKVNIFQEFQRNHNFRVPGHSLTYFSKVSSSIENVIKYLRSDTTNDELKQDLAKQCELINEASNLCCTLQVHLTNFTDLSRKSR